MTRNMPSAGDADVLLRDAVLDHRDRFAFWLLSHAMPDGARAWRTIILRECVPADFVFSAEEGIL